MATQRGCTQCGACLNTCPVFSLDRREEYSPKAKHEQIAHAGEDELALDWEKIVTLAGRCACCERCLSACPRKLSVPLTLAQARAKHPRWQQYFWKEWIEKGKALWPIASRLAPLAPNGILPEKLQIMHAAALAMKAPSAPTPWLRLDPKTKQTAKGVTAVLFGGCTATRLRPLWGEKATKIMQELGATLLSPEGFTCCGGTYEHAGMLEAANKAAQTNIEYWKSLGKPKIITFCASCIHGLRAYTTFEGLLDSELAKEWLTALTPVSEYLIEATIVQTANVPKQVFYHSPCHWGNKDADLIFLQKHLTGIHKGSTLCCGFGGVMKMLEPRLSKRMAESCWNGFGTIPAHIITGCSGCIMQLNSHAPKGSMTYHWLDVWQ